MHCTKYDVTLGQGPTCTPLAETMLVQTGADVRDELPSEAAPDSTASTIKNVDLCDKMRDIATMRDHTAGVAQLVERQPSKLNVEGSNPFARFTIKPSAEEPSLV